MKIINARTWVVLMISTPQTLPQSLITDSDKSFSASKGDVTPDDDGVEG